MEQIDNGIPGVDVFRGIRGEGRLPNAIGDLVSDSVIALATHRECEQLSQSWPGLVPTLCVAVFSGSKH